ncbi:hypothetical protein SynMEDNS5_00222 [Synechococcus sp. MEDNS5]|uniref:ribbon-helix-helix domain-containing protein n=1 Tax=Synechococcus sp. MEDNS5 TaxID=1442554 RepID=UPI0016464ECA|nr:CopG family transcriptional regulator [Synechococcus sp. MEDNS5]QNJ04983.1 hypothetical protein SynMEDNS5_00222 [Synechococcus sp. MEDNS5]
MRTTLQLDDDVLDAARVLARQQHLSVGEVISELARQALRRPAGLEEPPSERSGLPLLPIKSSGGVVDLNLVNQLRDEDR